MMDRIPVPPEKRRILEGLIRVTDLLIYATVIAGGVFALVFTPSSVRTELTGWEWMIPIWGGMLLAGGIGGFVGRLSRYWIIEVPALPLAAVGIGTYFLVLGSTAFSSPLAAVAATFVLVALLMMVRRYLELQIFASEPDDQDIRARVFAILRRRTRDIVPRNR